MSIPSPIVGEDLALWLEYRVKEDPYMKNLTNEEMRWRLGRRSLAKELLDLYRQQSSDERATTLTDIITKYQQKQSMPR